MSADGNGNGSVVDDASSVASNQQNAIDEEIIKNQAPQTPRFTQDEKQILYSLFHEHEEVIDIKFRKKIRSKCSVRDAWEQIVRDFNSHPNVNVIRSCKQIQKFWLNSRLRKQYPFGNQKQLNAANRSRTPQTIVQQQQQQQQQQAQQQQLINHAIKTEPEFQMGGSDTNDHNDQSESYEEIEMDGSAVTEDLDDDPLEAQQQHQQQQQVQTQQQQQQTQLQQVVPTSTIRVDQISADKLTLTDLIQFKTNRPREEIILQIKHAGEATGSQITLPSPAPTRITIPTHHQAQPHTMATITTNGYNQQIISEIKPQQITLAQYQAQQHLQQQQLAQQQQQQLAAQHAQLAVIQNQQQQQQQQAVAASAMAAAQQVKMQLQNCTAVNGTAQFANATPTFTCTTFSALPAVAAAAATVTSNNMTVSNATAIPTVATITTTPTLVNSSPLNNNNNNNNNVTTPLRQQAQPQEPNLYEEKMNYFRLKEAELRVKEQQVTLEKKKIELAHAEDQLKHLRELHRLQVEEIKVKIRIIQEEEKRLKETMSPLPS